MTEAPMQMKERSEAIQRAQRALKALGEHPRSSSRARGRAAGPRHGVLPKM